MDDLILYTTDVEAYNYDPYEIKFIDFNGRVITCRLNTYRVKRNGKLLSLIDSLNMESKLPSNWLHQEIDIFKLYQDLKNPLSKDLPVYYLSYENNSQKLHLIYPY